MNNLNKRCLNYDKLTEYKETNDQNTQWIWYKPRLNLWRPFDHTTQLTSHMVSNHTINYPVQFIVMITSFDLMIYELYIIIGFGSTRSRLKLYLSRFLNFPDNVT